jgi:hypothetical protein
MARTILWATLLAACLVGTGCGGGGGAQVPGPLGEGNIPVGKVVDPLGGRVRVRVTETGGRVQDAFSAPDGTVYLSSLRNGPARIELIPSTIGVEPMVIRIMAGPNQRHIFDASLLTEQMEGGISESSTIIGNFPNGELVREGEKRVLEFKLFGSRSSMAVPTFYVDGGVASVRENVLVGKVAGRGTLHVRYGPVLQSYRFQVTK